METLEFEVYYEKKFLTMGTLELKRARRHFRQAKLFRSISAVHCTSLINKRHGFDLASKKVS